MPNIYDFYPSQGSNLKKDRIRRYLGIWANMDENCQECVHKQMGLCSDYFAGLLLLVLTDGRVPRDDG